jgi:beta-phosphoglucomutase-like phosphatase (HAD superfamily)
MAVATNAEPANVEFVLNAAGIRDSIQAVVSGHDVDRPKPHPDVFLRAAELLGVAPEECVVFEDSRTGVAAANAAGMRVIGVLTTLTKFDNVELTIRNFSDPILDKWFSSVSSSASVHC